MSLGFELAGFHVMAAVDFDPIHLQTYSRNFPRCRPLLADISRLSGDQLRATAGLSEVQIDVVFGGPPCQGFSLMGRRSLDDPRNSLLQDFARLVSELRPRYFVAENVEGLLRGKTAVCLETFVDSLKRTGYDVRSPVAVLDASSFGVPQTRRRVFILGGRSDLALPEQPRPLASQAPTGNPKVVTVWDAIGDIPNVDDVEYLLSSDVFYGKLAMPSPYAALLRNGDEIRRRLKLPGHTDDDGLTGCMRTRHGRETIGRFARTEPGTCEPVSRFYRLEKQGLAPTLRAGTTKAQGSFTAPRPIHPVHPRCVTVREAARIHSFFDWFTFHPTKWHGFRQVGNAVPPFLARAVAESIMKGLTR